MPLWRTTMPPSRWGQTKLQITWEKRDLLRGQRDIRRMAKELRMDSSVMKRVEGRIISLLLTEARRYVKVNTGRLRAAIRVETGNIGYRHAAMVSPMGSDNVQYGVYYDIYYGAYVEMTSPAHWPPVQPIKDWIKQRGLESHYSKKSDSEQNRLDQMTYLVRRTIARRGTYGDNNLDNAVARSEPTISAMYTRAIAAVVEKEGY
jgi:hypothetical protein